MSSSWRLEVNIISICTSSTSVCNHKHSHISPTRGRRCIRSQTPTVAGIGAEGRRRRILFVCHIDRHPRGTSNVCDIESLLVPANSKSGKAPAWLVGSITEEYLRFAIVNHLLDIYIFTTARSYPESFGRALCIWRTRRHG